MLQKKLCLSQCDQLSINITYVLKSSLPWNFQVIGNKLIISYLTLTRTVSVLRCNILRQVPFTFPDLTNYSGQTLSVEPHVLQLSG